jgi:glycosyltransferase involved in cell wall biosynthesis
MTPVVSVGMPTYRGERFLAAAISSLLAQDLADIEVVISDNGSDDGTEAICRSFAREDERVRYFRVEQNRGAAWNYNAVLAAARGRYFKWAADDDVCEPSFLRRCVDALEAAPRAVLAYPQTILIDADGAELGPLDDGDLDLRRPDPVDRLAALLRHRVEWHPVFGVMRTDAVRRTRGIGAFVYADVAVLAELAVLGEFHQVPERLFLRRYHERRSIAANPSFEAHAAWYDPSRRAKKAALPQARLVRELVARAVAAPLPPTQRARAVAAVIGRWGLPHWRHIGGEVRMASRRRFAASAP